MQRLLRLIVIIILISANLSCHTKKHEAVQVSVEQITDSLKNVAISFLRSWEPPFDPQKAISLFTPSEDFFLIIDGYETRSFEEWAEGVPLYMADDSQFFSSYSHEIKNIKTVILSPHVGVVTIIYIWDNISIEGIHKKVNGAITMVCRFEENRWRIVHYHGSHGDEQIIE